MNHRSLVLALALTGACSAAADPRTVPNPPADGGFVPLADGGAVRCVGNRDGVISRDEVVFAPGVEVRYRVNPPGTMASVDVTGTARPDGTRAWDFSDTAGELATLTLQTTEGQWFAARFPGAQYAARLDPRAPLLGVYRASAERVDLLGAVGASERDGTLLRYDAPLALLRFPLRVGATWTSEATTTDSTVEGVPVASRDRYEVTVDAAGELRLGIFTVTQALRVRVELTQRFPAGPGNRKIQYLWMTECYGEVARVTSLDGEVDPDFTRAAEYRRLGL